MAAAEISRKANTPRLNLQGLAVSSVDQAEAMVDEIMQRFDPDPLPIYKRLLAEAGPFVRGFAYSFGHGELRTTIARGAPMPEANTLMALSYDAVKECLFDQVRFRGNYDDFGAMQRDGQTGLPMLEGLPHQRLRRLLAQGLNPRSIHVWENRMIRPVVQNLLRNCSTGVSLEMARKFCRPLPGAAIGAVLGLTPEDLDAFNLLAFLSFTGPFTEEGKKAELLLSEYFNEHIEQRRSVPDDELAQRDDVISLMVRARIGDDKLSNEEIVPNLFFFLFAGSDTTYLTLCNIIYYLVEEPGLYEAVKNNRDLIKQLIEETLRLHPPGPIIARRAKVDTEVCGVSIKADTVIAINLLMANHDPAAWERADDFKLDRSVGHPHLSFGFGPHMCPGMHLARLEMTVALNEIFDRFNGMEWAPGISRPSFTGLSSRAVEHATIVLH